TPLRRPRQRQNLPLPPTGSTHMITQSEYLAAVDGGEFADILTNAAKFDVTEERGGSAQLMPQSAVGRSPNDVKPLAGPSGGDRAESADVKGGGERPGPSTSGECGGKGLQVHPCAQNPGGKGLC